MTGEETNEELVFLTRQEFVSCGEIHGIRYQIEWSVVYLAGGSFYFDFPIDVEISDMAGLSLEEDEILEMKASLLSEFIEELKKAPYYTVRLFGYEYIPNPMIDPDFDPSIDPFEEWGFAG
jgi:hypothetical protein